jgi:ankyrin repeat protein
MLKEASMAMHCKAASVSGHKKVVRILLDTGAEVNAQGGKYGNALQAASLYGYKKLVRILLEARVDVNAQGGEYGNALQAASWHSHKVVQMLLDAGAEVNTQVESLAMNCKPYQYIVSYIGHGEVVQMLLDAGADITPEEDSIPMHCS